MKPAANSNPQQPIKGKGTLQLKVCGMRQPQNILAVLALQPDYVGFIFYAKSARFIGGELSEEILHQFPAGTKKVGVFVNETVGNMLDQVTRYQLDAVQLHGEEPPEICRQMKTAGLEVIKAFSVDDAFDFKKLGAYAGTCDFYLFDTKGKTYGGNGVRFNWNILENYNGETPYFLSGGIDLEHVVLIKALRLPLLRGIDINSRFELSPALKDSTKVQAFFQLIRQDK